MTEPVAEWVMGAEELTVTLIRRLNEQIAENAKLQLSCKQWEADALRYHRNAEDRLNENTKLRSALEEIAKQDQPHSYRGALLKCLVIARRALEDGK